MSTIYAGELAKIGQGLAADARIVVVGGDVGNGDVGRAATKTLADLTGADIAVVRAPPEGAPPVQREVIFVDASVPDYQALLAQINRPDARMVLLDGTRDAIDQMASYLDGESGISAVHVISHGRAGFRA